MSDKINISYENLVSIINSKEMVNLSDVSIGCFACLQLNSSIYNGIVDIELLCKIFFMNIAIK